MKDGEAPQIPQSATCASNTHMCQNRKLGTQIFYNKLREEGGVHSRDQQKANGRWPRVTPEGQGPRSGQVQEERDPRVPSGLR